MAETRPSVDTAQGKIPANPVFLVGQNGATLGGLFLTDLTQYPLSVDVDVAGADTDVLIVGENGFLLYIIYAYFQPQGGSQTITLKHDATQFAPPQTVADGKQLIVGDLLNIIAEHVVPDGEDYAMTKGSATAVRGKIYYLKIAA